MSDDDFTGDLINIDRKSDDKFAEHTNNNRSSHSSKDAEKHPGTIGHSSKGASRVKTASKKNATEQSSKQPALNPQPSLLNPSERIKKPIYVAAIGASAGGLQPLEDFFRAIPTNTGIAFVVVQHLSPDFKSLMHELLCKHTSMPIVRVVDTVEPEANKIYLITPRKNMTMENGKLILTDQDLSPGHGPNFPIDMFFRSLAESHGNRAIGIILSGTGSDGSRGVRAIDEAGGLVYVQSTESAQFDGMPAAAIVTGTAHEVKPPAKIAESISDIASSALHLDGNSNVDERMSAVYKQIIKMVAEEKGVDFRLYKPTTIARRLERRRLIAGATSLEDYLSKLQSDDQEVTSLRNDLLVSVTCFFRDEAAWKILSNSVLPALIKKTQVNETIRVWVAACATGEEAYTMAMTLREVLDSMNRHQQEVKIFATDIDEPALERAASGRYPGSIVADVPPDLMAKYFTPDGDFYQINRVIREMIIFAPHNLLEDAPFTRTHIVSCRNALIYLQGDVQKKVVRVLHFSLCNSGILFLGSSETVGDLKTEFQVLDHPSSILEKIRDVRLSPQATFHARQPGLSTARPLPPAHTPANRTPDASSTDSLISTAFSALAMENNTVYLICDEHMNMLHAVGDTRPFLSIPQGEVTNDLSRLVPKSLSVPLSTAMHRARREGNVVNYYGIPHSDNPDDLIDIQATYQAANAQSIEMYIVLLIAQPVITERTLVSDSSEEPVTGVTHQRLKDLEIELHQTRENLQTTIEELENTNETMQTTNEQLTTANEELQSTNEELHSVNEELYTVNSEHQVKINELTELNNDIDNLLESTDIGVVFLDDDLNIRKFTPAAAYSVSLQPGDIGRSFEDLSYSFDYPQLATDVRRVLSLGEAIEREAAINENDYILVRIHPYRAGNELTVGVVISFVDISELKHVEDALAQVEVRYRHLFQSDMFGIVVSNLQDRTVIDANDTFLKLIDADRSMLPLKQQSIYPENDLGNLSLAMEELHTSGTTPPTAARMVKRDGHLVPVIVSRTLISQKDGTFVEFIIDATELKQQQREIQLKTDEMEAVSGNLQQFAYIASHELLEPLRSLSGYSNLLADRYATQLDGDGVDYVNFILEASTRMSRVVDDLLSFSRVHTKGKRFSYVDCNTALQVAREGILKASGELEIAWDITPLPNIFADEDQLQQLFFTLLENSIKFRSDRTLALKIGAAQVDGNWQFEISDNGIGIERGDTEKVFAIFKRLHSREAYPGSGVGLAICKRIVERHNGTIWAEPNEKSGCSIFFTLPQGNLDAPRLNNKSKTDRL